MRSQVRNVDCGVRSVRSRVVTRHTARTAAAACDGLHFAERRVATRLNPHGCHCWFYPAVDAEYPLHTAGRASSGTRRYSNPHSAFRTPHSTRSAISLIEILISMFVLLFGLMGVAAIFPVGNHYVVEGEKFDLGSSLAQNAFEELRARGVLRAELWYHADHTDPTPNDPTDDYPVGTPVIDPVGSTFSLPPANAGHAFVIDPIGGAVVLSPPNERWFFPSGDNTTSNPWPALMFPDTGGPVATSAWPIRRVTLPRTSNYVFNSAVAETIFRLRDDLAVEMPEQDDRPSIQRWNVDGGGALLSRQYQGNYSWLATVVPSDEAALKSLQPGDPMRDEKATYDVSVVVFRGRDETPSATSERLIRAELVSQSELVIYDDTASLVDAAVDDIRPGNWIAITGVHQTTGKFMMKWYRLLAIDDDTVFDTDANYTVQSEGGSFYLRFAMLAEPSWPLNAFNNLRAVLMPGAISVVTHQMKMQE